MVRRGDGGPLGAVRVDQEAHQEAVLTVVGWIPAAKVLTYGDISELLGHGGPRRVGRALSLAGSEVPWWRVLRAGGHPAQGLAHRARTYYDAEGTPLLLPAREAYDADYRVDLARARWSPTESEHVRLARLSDSLGGVGP